MQRLLNDAVWDTTTAMGVIRRFVAEHLAPPAGGLAVAALDETGQEKKGSSTAGVKRQYMGCAGQVANGINTVHCSYATRSGHALIGARLYLPAEQLDDPNRRTALGIPTSSSAPNPSWPSTSSPTPSPIRRCPHSAPATRSTAGPAPMPTRPDQPPPSDPGLIPLTVAEVKRLFNLITRRHLPEHHHLRWSLWRRRHQARARWFHHRARLEPRTS